MHPALRRLRGEARSRLGRTSPVVTYRSRRLARSSKRLDLAAAQVAHALHLSGPFDGPPLEGKRCMEIGAGWVLTHSLVFHLLGASEIVATDLSPLARPGNLKFAINDSSAGLIRDVLSPFTDPVELRRRLERLYDLPSYDWDFVARCGIDYVAPFDLAKGPIGRPVDFVFSESVLEHVPVDQIASVIGSVANDVAPGGFMVHRIHLEDHHGIVDDPFAFLEAKSFDRGDQSRRGNRVRPSEWMRRFRAVPDLDSRVLFQWTNPDARVPAEVDPAIHYVDKEDLMACNLAVLSTKRAAPN
jgi:hypothetical protein